MLPEVLSSPISHERFWTFDKTTSFLVSKWMVWFSFHEPDPIMKSLKINGTRIFNRGAPFCLYFIVCLPLSTCDTLSWSWFCSLCFYFSLKRCRLLPRYSDWSLLAFVYLHFGLKMHQPPGRASTGLSSFQELGSCLDLSWHPFAIQWAWSFILSTRHPLALNEKTGIYF